MCTACTNDQFSADTRDSVVRLLLFDCSIPLITYNLIQSVTCRVVVMLVLWCFTHVIC
jgi:hypothetical protein